MCSKASVAALSSLVLDLIVTAGVYSLVGFEVTPSTVIGFLTMAPAQLVRRLPALSTTPVGPDVAVLLSAQVLPAWRGRGIGRQLVTTAAGLVARRDLRALEAVGNHKRFGFNYDPSHLGYQGVDYVRFIYAFGPRIFHAHMKDAWWGHGTGEAGVFGGHTNFGDPRRYWDFRSVGRGDIDFEEIIVALNDVGYTGPLSIEWEDSRMDRVHGATESAAFTRQLDFAPAAGAFDAAFGRD